MVQAALDRGFDIGLVTNGVLLGTLNNPEAFKFIRVSLDAASHSIYASIKGKKLLGTVLTNIKDLVSKRNRVTEFPTIGISYVVCDQNRNEIDAAKKIQKELGIDYIQFKPVSLPNLTSELKIDNGEGTIITNRYKALDNLPCLFSSLIGVIGANGKCYFCCQKRGESSFELGDLRKDSFGVIWKRHIDLNPDISNCVSCRYMNYVNAYKNLPPIILKHRNFL
jgi:MoaA/NifB/PqqE/SkfB family radical SAM enzyme